MACSGEWELIHKGDGCSTYVLKIVGGWLIRCMTPFLETCSITFIPDTNHRNYPHAI